MLERWLSAREIFEPKHISRNTFYRLVKAGKLPPGERVGLQAVRWRESAIEAAFAAMNGKAPSEHKPEPKRANPALAVVSPPRPLGAISSASDLEAAAEWLASQASPPRPVIPALREMFGFSAFEACTAAARAFDLRSAQ